MSIHFIEDFSRDELRKFLQNEDVVVHHARCIIVGCSGAGKTTLLKRLEGASFKEVKDLQKTESVDVHVNQFEVLENENTIKRKVYEIIISLNRINSHQYIIDITRTITSLKYRTLRIVTLSSTFFQNTTYMLYFGQIMLKTFLNNFKCIPTFITERSTNGQNGILNKLVSFCIILYVKGSKEENSLTFPFSVDGIKNKKTAAAPDAPAENTEDGQNVSVLETTTSNVDETVPEEHGEGEPLLESIELRSTTGMYNPEVDPLNAEDPRSDVGRDIEKNVSKNDETSDTSPMSTIMKAVHYLSEHPRNSRITFLDFAGESIYYVSHQIYLSPKTVYILVVDMSKEPDEKESKTPENKLTRFESWTYKGTLNFINNVNVLNFTMKKIMKKIDFDENVTFI